MVAPSASGAELTIPNLLGINTRGYEIRKMRGAIWVDFVTDNGAVNIKNHMATKESEQNVIYFFPRYFN